MIGIAQQFRLEGVPKKSERYGHGHINETFFVETDVGQAYILQRINHRVFKNISGLMHNVGAVTRFLAEKEPASQHALRLIPTLDGQDYLRDERGEYWRVYNFIQNSVCLERAETEKDFAQSARMFGRFQQLLADFPADTLVETIPRFHDTPDRFALLREAIEADAVGRVEGVPAEIEAVLAYEKEADGLMCLLRQGRLPLRVTHNDTKLNNVIFDRETREPICVVDLDTVMPGLVANDFGDSIRFGASTAAEDEMDLERVKLSLPLYEAYTKAFLAACGESLLPLEIETLPMGAKRMTLECGIRFLTDHLAGDVYFRIDRPGHNLDRFRTQYKLVRSMEENWEAMCAAVR